ncbi:MAG: fibronectin type III domain-containing protein [Deltaproteobacteria bacterium]|nr:fibronectin type III domain-containing protein [Deltaproteobacteria bacterium]
MRRIACLTCALLAAGCADEQPPAWPQAARLEASDIQSDRARLCWPAASDDRGVVGYILLRDTDALPEIDPGATSLELAGLKDATAYTLELRAVDEAGNRSAPLRLELRIPDKTPPSWGSQAAVRAELLNSNRDQHELRLSWKPASDNVSVAGYRLLRKEAPPEDLAPESTSLELVLSDLETRLALEARDQAGNRSPELPVDLDAARAKLRRKRDLESALASRSGLLKILGSKGPAGHELVNVFGRGRIDDAFEGLSGLSVGSMQGAGGDHMGLGGVRGGGGGGGGMGVLASRGRAVKTERKKEPAVRIASVSTSGKGVDPDRVRAFLREHKADFLHCYTQSLERNGDASGARIFEIQIAKDTRVRPRGGELAEPALDACAIGVLERLAISGADGKAAVMLSFTVE